MLNEKEETFAIWLMQGLEPGEAYKKAGFNITSKIGFPKVANDLAESPKITDYIKECKLQDKLENAWNREKALFHALNKMKLANEDVKAYGINQANTSLYFQAFDRANKIVEKK